MSREDAAAELVAALEAVQVHLATDGRDDWARWCTTIVALARRGDPRASARFFAAFEGEGDLGALAADDEDLAALLAGAHDAAVAFDQASSPGSAQ